MIYIFIIMISWIVLSVFRDYGHIEGDSKLWHSAEAGIRLIFTSYFSVERYGLTLEAGMFCLLLLMAFWILFDLGLNKKRNKDWLYVGQTALMDRMFRKVAEKFSLDVRNLMLNTKLLLFIILTIIFLTI